MSKAQRKNSTKYVLSIEGGGLRGIIPATLLNVLDSHGKLPVFDLYCGVSTGGLIALSLVAGYSPEYIHEIYTTRGAEIFSRSFWSRISTLWNPKHSNAGLKKVLNEMFGDRMMYELQRKVMLPVTPVETLEDDFIFSWKPRFTDTLLTDAALRTTAAPTYFPLIDEWCDGGVHSNRPAFCAYTEARELWPKDRIKVLSLGCGHAPVGGKPEDLKSAGLIKWGKTLAEGYTTPGMSKELHFCEKWIPSGDFLHLNIEVPREYAAMDEPKNSNILEVLGLLLWQKKQDELWEWLEK